MNITIKRRGTIVGYTDNGKVRVKLADGSSETNYEYFCDIPVAYANQSGAFIGGYPEIFTEVYVEQSQGRWTISGYATPDNIYNNRNSGNVISNEIMSDLKSGNILIQTSNAENKIILNNSSGITLGSANNYLQQDTDKGIFVNFFENSFQFSSASRKIEGVIKRDVKEVSDIIRYDSQLNQTSYDDFLYPIGMDPIQPISFVTTSPNYRNLPLSESREIFFELYEQSDSLSFGTDRAESNKYVENFKFSDDITPLRSASRSSAFDLNLYYPNKLIEVIKGTGVDNLSNIIDLNRNIIPLGIGKLSLQENEDNIDAFAKIRAAHRKSIAYHFEINARKDLEKDKVYEVPDSSDRSNYSRSRSTFFFDVDKEGQFKANIPMSSEVGNIPIPTRYINASVLAFEDALISKPDVFYQNDTNIDIFLQDYSSNKPSETTYKGIELIDESESGNLELNSQKKLKLNTVYHDILKAGYKFTKAAIQPNLDLTTFMPEFSLNGRKNEIQYDNIVSDKIYLTGERANAGGRSGTINTDGMLNLSIGANTVDRQSLWLDTAGGVVSTIGRDSRGISYSATLDGDLIIQIGGPGLGSQLDDRFKNQNSGFKAGVMDIRLLDENGAQVSILRFDGKGLSVYSFGRMEFMCQQDMIFRSKSNILMEAENIGFYHQTTPRFIKRNGVPEI